MHQVLPFDRVMEVAVDGPDFLLGGRPQLIGEHEITDTSDDRIVSATGPAYQY